MRFSDLVADAAVDRMGRRRFIIPKAWMQGRTTYGGLTMALAHATAAPLADGLALRSAQLALVQPVGGEMIAVPGPLRRRPSSAFIAVDMQGGDGVAARALFAFGIARESEIPPHRPPAPEDPGEPGEGGSLSAAGLEPSFLAQFEVRRVRGGTMFSGAEPGDLLLWIRHLDPDARSGLTALLALADAPPPVALTMMTTPHQISTMTWQADVLDPRPETREGWWLVRVHPEGLGEGYAQQTLTVFNTDGEAVLSSRQVVAVFG